MQAVWYEEFGPARDVLVHGRLPDPVPGPGGVAVRVRASGVNPSDVKLRAGARAGAQMEFPRIVPHSDGAGVIEAVGAGVDPARVGQRVWIWNATWRRPFGTAAEFVVLPSPQAVRLADSTSFAQGACLGIPAMAAWYAVCGGAPVAGKTVLVTGGRCGHGWAICGANGAVKRRAGDCHCVFRRKGGAFDGERMGQLPARQRGRCGQADDGRRGRRPDC